MASEFLRRRRTKKIAEEYVNEIIDKLSHNPAVDKSATIPFNADSLQKDFTAQLESLLERDAEEGERPIWRELFLRDEYKIFADDETALFVKIFGDGVGIFGLGAANDNFKILSLCFTEPERSREARTLDFVFGAFTKTFFPKVAPDEVRDVLKANYFFTAGDLLFTLIQSGKLNMLNVVAERSS
ncbi:MAG: hypothetical protein IJ774_14990 [Selenomonadaceae bacterium]|nr:hypothetical protein [Selenomonadaceae bacterium]